MCPIFQRCEYNFAACTRATTGCNECGLDALPILLTPRRKTVPDKSLTPDAAHLDSGILSQQSNSQSQFPDLFPTAVAAVRAPRTESCCGVQAHARRRINSTATRRPHFSRKSEQSSVLLFGLLEHNDYALLFCARHDYVKRGRQARRGRGRSLYLSESPSSLWP